MARLSDEFVMAWSSLSGGAGESGWQAIPVAAAGPLDLRAGRRAPESAEAVLVFFPTVRLSQTETLPGGQGFTVERVDPEGDGRLCLALTRRPSGSADLFTDMACNVAGALDEAVAEGAPETKLLRIFIGRVRAWQEFMRKGAQPLGPEAEIGLFGELVTLSAMMNAGVMPSTAASAWVGPLDYAQDFEIGTGAIEAKATIASTGFTATIGSLAQLDDSNRQPLFVVATRLRAISTGITLPQMIATVREKMNGDIAATNLFAERLLNARYHDSHEKNYTRRFEIAGARALKVGPTFPRLTIATVPPGVLSAVYDIDLNRLDDIGIEVPDALKLLGAI